MRLFLLLAVAYFLPLGLKAQSNVYKPFPLIDGATWKVSWQDHDCVIPPNYGNAKYEYTLLYDTTISAQTYKILKAGPSISGIQGCVGPNGYVGYKIGGLRQDTAARKVYYYNFNDSAEYLLFDYTLQVGDTIEGYLTRMPYDYDLTVLSIDSVLVGNNYHKAIRFVDYNHILIEGVGSDAGLLECLWYFEAGSNLMCMVVPGYPTAGDSLCNSFNLSPVNESSANAGIFIFPNPATADFTVKINASTQNLAVQLYNSLGQQVGSYIGAGNQVSIPRNNLPGGLYVVQLQLGSTVSRHKLLFTN